MIIGGTLALLSLGVLSLGLSATLGTSGTQPPPPDSMRGTKLLAPGQGAYTGAYIDFGEHEDEVTLEKIDAFATLVGKRQALVAFSNFWGRGHFPTPQARIIVNAGATPVLFWNPWDRRDGKRRTEFDLNEIAAGRWDEYIDTWASEARAFGKPLLVAWGLEMNGNWFPWSGVLHGGGEPIPGSDPPLHKGPETFKRAYRHVVDRVRAAGASNISWLFHVNNASIPRVSWNRMAAYYPGGDYVDWLAMSAYGKQFPTQPWVGVDKAILGPYQELAAVDPSKPVLLAEWGIGEFPKQGDKGAWIDEAFEAMEQRMPRLKGAVFWHERWQNKDLSYSNLRVNSSLPALTAFRKGVSRPFWLAEPRNSTTQPESSGQRIQ
ncbi:hypothetical protein CKO27_05380 [Thiocystis violacea]|nr:hypothetical protein [Thiocystis violacea]